MSRNSRPSQWEDLLKQAYKIIDHVNRDHELLTSWTFGGGTAMMLQINHRESHDIDLFLDDPQLLPFVTAAVGEMDFEIGVPSYNGDGTGHLKIAFETSLSPATSSNRMRRRGKSSGGPSISKPYPKS